MGCGGRLGREVLRVNLDGLTRGRLWVTQSREVGHRGYRGATTVSRHAFYATVMQESSRWTARIAGGKCARQQRLIAGRRDEGLIPMKKNHA